MDRKYWKAGALCVGTALAGLLLVEPVPAVAEQIRQPINFKHKTHAIKDEIPCEFCHIYARRSKISGIPPVRTCVGCHNVIKGSTAEQQSEIAKIFKYWSPEDGSRPKAIPWKRNHDLPDFVRFSHKRHVKAGFDCTNCHGEVGETETTPALQRKISGTANKADEIPQSMGWCMSCHKTAHPVANGKVHQKLFRATRGTPKTQPSSSPDPGKFIKGSKDCLVCHK